MEKKNNLLAHVHTTHSLAGFAISMTKLNLSNYFYNVNVTNIYIFNTHSVSIEQQLIREATKTFMIRNLAHEFSETQFFIQELQVIKRDIAEMGIDQGRIDEKYEELIPVYFALLEQCFIPIITSIKKRH